MDVEDARLAQRLTHVRLASFAALVRSSCAVVDLWPAVAVVAASSQLCKEGVGDLGIDRPYLLRTDALEDVSVSQAAIVLASLEAELGVGKVARDQLFHRRVGPGVATLVDLVPEAGENLLGFLLGIWAGWNGLA